MIPKKLDVINRDDHAERFLHAAGIEDTYEIRNKINELIDYLQAKEEASKGECKHCGFKYGGALTLHERTVNLGKELEKLDPPQQEEELVNTIARGWCHTSTSSKVMDTELAKEIGNEVRHHINKFYVSKEKIKRAIGAYDWTSSKDSKEKHTYNATRNELRQKILKELGLGD